jgi:hypothetical protein
MLENANETSAQAPENVRDRKTGSESERLRASAGHRRSRKASQNAPSNSSDEGAERINSCRPGWKTLALSCLHAGSLARQTCHLTIGTVRNKKHLDRNELPIYSDGVRRHRLNKGEALFRRTRYQHGSVEREERKKGPSVWVYRWWEEHINGKLVHRKAQVGDVKNTRPNLRHTQQQTLFG